RVCCGSCGRGQLSRSHLLSVAQKSLKPRTKNACTAITPNNRLVWWCEVGCGRIVECAVNDDESPNAITRHKSSKQPCLLLFLLSEPPGGPAGFLVHLISMIRFNGIEIKSGKSYESKKSRRAAGQSRFPAAHSVRKTTESSYADGVYK